MASRTNLASISTKSVVFRQHQRQDRLPVVTRTNVSDNVYRLRPPWFHEERDPDGGPIRTWVTLLRRAEHQKQEIMQASRYGLTFAGDAGRRYDIPVVERPGNSGVHLETYGFCCFGNIHEHALSDCLFPGIRINYVPILVINHQDSPVFCCNR